MISEATKIYFSFIPIRIGEPFVVVHILCGCFLSIITIPHCGFYEFYLIIFYVFAIAYNIVLPLAVNFPSNWAATSVSVSLENFTSPK